MGKLTRSVAIFSTAIFCIILPCLILIITGTVNLSVGSFAVDAADRLYVGTENEIRVYQDNRLIDTINPQTSKSYAFTIREDGTVILATTSKIYTMDLEGNIIQEQEDPGADMYLRLKAERRRFTAPNGDEYKLVGSAGRTRIVKNGRDTVYKISLMSVVVKFLLIAVVISIFVFAFYAIKKRIRNTQDSKRFA